MLAAGGDAWEWIQVAFRTTKLPNVSALAADYDAVLTCDKPSTCRTSGPDMLVL